MRLYGDRELKTEGQPTATGSDNEIWLYGEEVYEIYDKKSWNAETEYPYGSKYFVAPVLEAGRRSISAHLPVGSSWKGVKTSRMEVGSIN
ncbi:hypothetical protein EYZ11_008858 [Aspergillus tanneri]|uniref:Uncharacterized protein n=1 Tax=Aspergillus tanneri TaxID=1220188 RepID=A0A4S3JBK3_9EURO|nr:hypothetical protein EYZ11_008858 [Aspergillus tanneri]